ncbi:BCL2/adenovirus E1B 19 kDa protein-interacting protein 3 [Condylostylus longicornis]|uniref:BCL2/adenovirus E1B 19 kDa protein-interacting protein 3 n=1 Tax=Condylostylus longicornis TaxID=2530218 RepID=UPI00244E4C1B|nr:BCL2/adenovirus E1B 19 kDa protein-interacting protein 3 [Condylostylus longicornis]
MTSTPILNLTDSWIELSGQNTPDKITPLPFSSGDEYLRLLREAQKESNQSSRVVSLASSRRDTPRSSPKSPPNSPNTELCPDNELKNVYINYCLKKDKDAGKDSENFSLDWIWRWSSRPDQKRIKDWNFEHPKRKIPPGYSIRSAKIGNSSIFSRNVMYSLVLTNVLSLLLGAGLGLWLSKRGLLFTRITIE